LDPLAVTSDRVDGKNGSLGKVSSCQVVIFPKGQKFANQITPSRHRRPHLQDSNRISWHFHMSYGGPALGRSGNAKSSVAVADYARVWTRSIRGTTVTVGSTEFQKIIDNWLLRSNSRQAQSWAYSVSHFSLGANSISPT
jgi:hypothetical protein